MIWNTSSPFLKWSPSSSFPLVTSHLLAITKPSPYWFFHSVTVRCKVFSLMSAAQTCRQMSTYQYKPTHVGIKESWICICTLFHKKMQYNFLLKLKLQFEALRLSRQWPSEQTYIYILNKYAVSSISLFCMATYRIAI